LEATPELPTERVVDVLGNFLVLEETDAERVGSGFVRGALAKAGAHGAAV
jgi:hypothetical protein